MYRLSPQQVMTSFVGRERDSEAVSDLLVRSDVRIVTLTGPGGVGKTRLAFHVAEQLKSLFPDGVVSVDLASVTRPDFVLPAIAECFNITDSGDDAIMNRLSVAVGSRRMLFLIDNFEQVADGGMVISRLLNNLLTVSFLITSRMPLHIIGEYEYAVSSLDVPPAVMPGNAHHILLDVPAVQLFVQRAQAVHRSFNPTEEMLATIGRITILLDGLPLAIELAAARTKLFSLTALQGRLNDRLALLTGGPRDLPHRLQTMRNAIFWSYDLLSEEEQLVFRRISVFSGSFSLQAAEAIVGQPVSIDEQEFISPETGSTDSAQQTPDLLRHLHSLIDKSLLQLLPDTREDIRFRMMFTIQEYALEQLEKHGELLLMRMRMLRYFSQHLRDVEDLLNGPEQRMWLARLDADSGNIRNAMQTALDHPQRFGAFGLQLASTMWRYWLIRGQPIEGVRWLEDMLAHRAVADISDIDEARALNRLGNLRLDLGNHTDASTLYRESLAIYRLIGVRDGIADELNNLGLVQLIQGEIDQARDSLDESLAIRRKGGDPTALPSTLSNLGDVAVFLEQYDLAEKYHAEALKIVRDVGNLRRIAFGCYSLGMIAYCRQEFDRAQAWLDEGLEYQAQIDDSYTMGLIMLGLGRLNLTMGNTLLAVERLRRALQVLQKMGSRRVMMDVIDVIAITGARFGFPSISARLLGAVHAVRVAEQIAVSPRADRCIARTRRTLAGALGEEASVREFVVGERQTLDQAVGEAVSLLQHIRERAESGETEHGGENGSFNPAAASASERSLGLTRRERQVLEHLVQGASDKEIADELSIAPRTAMTHVANILAKLGVNRRTAAASVALREGLVDPANVGEVEVQEV